MSSSTKDDQAVKQALKEMCRPGTAKKVIQFPGRCIACGNRLAITTDGAQRCLNPDCIWFNIVRAD